MIEDLCRHVYVTTTEEANAAILELQQASILGLDLEGANLGREGGSLSLLQIATSSTTYVFDIQVRAGLKPAARKHVLHRQLAPHTSRVACRRYGCHPSLK